MLKATKHTKATKDKIAKTQKDRWSKLRLAANYYSPLAGGPEKEAPPLVSSEPVVEVARIDTNVAGFNNWTAPKIQGYLDSTKTGRLRDFIRMCDALRLRDLHLTAVIEARKSGVTSRKLLVKTKGRNVDSPSLLKARDLLQKNIDDLPMSIITAHLLEGVYVGVSVAEKVWKYDLLTDSYYIDEIVPISAAKFSYDDDLELFIDDQWASSDFNGQRLYDFPHRFIVHEPKQISEYSNMDGLMRLCAFIVFFKMTSQMYTMAGLAKFAFPPVVCTVPEQTQAATISSIKSQVEAFNSDSVAIVKQGTDFKPLVTGVSGDASYMNFIKYLDDQVSKLILRGTMTVDDGSSRAQSEVHERGEAVLVRSDGEKLLRTLYNDLLRSFVEVNEHLFPDVSIDWICENLTIEFDGLYQTNPLSIDQMLTVLDLGAKSNLVPTQDSIQTYLESYGIQTNPTITDTGDGEGQAQQTQAVEETALNGAQVQSLQGLLAAMAEGVLAPETAKLVIRNAFPTMSPVDINAMVDAQSAFMQTKQQGPTVPENGAPIEQGLSLQAEEEKPFVVSYTKPEVGQTWIDTTDNHRLVIKAIDPTNVYCVDLDAENPDKQFAWSVRHFREICSFESAPEND